MDLNLLPCVFSSFCVHFLILSALEKVSLFPNTTSVLFSTNFLSLVLSAKESVSFLRERKGRFGRSDFAEVAVNIVARLPTTPWIGEIRRYATSILPNSRTGMGTIAVEV